MKIFYITIGILSVVLGAIGIFLPGFPTTPWVLLASWCFYRSSPRLQAWLLKSFLGKYIRDYQGGLSLRKRIFIILLMATMVAVSTILFIDSLPIRIVVWVAGVIGCVVVCFLHQRSVNNKC